MRTRHAPTFFPAGRLEPSAVERLAAITDPAMAKRIAAFDHRRRGWDEMRFDDLSVEYVD